MTDDAKKLDLEYLKALCGRGLTMGEQAEAIQAIPLLVAEVERLTALTQLRSVWWLSEALHAREEIVRLEARLDLYRMKGTERRVMANRMSELERERDLLQEGVNNIPNIIQDVMKERDAARAEVERLHGILNLPPIDPSAEITGTGERVGTVELPVLNTADPNLNCFLCTLGKVDRSVHVRFPGRSSAWGVHDRCLRQLPRGDLQKERDVARTLAERRKKALEPFLNGIYEYDLKIARNLQGRVGGAFATSDYDEAKAAHDAEE